MSFTLANGASKGSEERFFLYVSQWSNEKKGLNFNLLYLVEDVVVLLCGKRADDPGLVQEVAVDLGPVERSLAHLHLDEVALQLKSDN